MADICPIIIIIVCKNVIILLKFSYSNIAISRRNSKKLNEIIYKENMNIHSTPCLTIKNTPCFFTSFHS